MGQLEDPKGTKRHPQKAPKRTKNGYQKRSKNKKRKRRKKRARKTPQDHITWPSCERKAAREFSASWCLLDAFWVPLECLLGPLASLLALLGGLLGASWEPLGGLLAPLGGALLRTLNFDQFWTAFRSLLGTSWDPNGKPKGTQNGAQEAPKSSTVFDIEKVPLQDRLGAILGPSWGVFGAIFRGKNLQKPLCFPCFFAETTF